MFPSKEPVVSVCSCLIHLRKLSLRQTAYKPDEMIFTNFQDPTALHLYGMDVFRILSRGALLKKSKNVTTDYALPAAKQNTTQNIKEAVLAQQVEKETDFFHTRKHAATAEDDNGEAQKSSSAAKNNQEATVVPPPKIASQEDADILRRSYKCKITGLDVPLPSGSFEDLISRYQLDGKLLQNLLANGFVEPTSIQCESIPISLSGRDLIACAPTGSGKSLAFLIPSIQTILEGKPQNSKLHGVRGLIISPTNELAVQIFQELLLLTKSKKDLKVAILSKQLASKLTNGIINGSKYDIIVSTPLRLIEVVKLGKLDLSKIEEIVIW